MSDTIDTTNATMIDELRVIILALVSAKRWRRFDNKGKIVHRATSATDSDYNAWLKFNNLQVSDTHLCVVQAMGGAYTDSNGLRKQRKEHTLAIVPLAGEIASNAGF
ncbi:MAG: hypothetical protein HOG49_43245 [Candidatus Scalindua sp.]|jgi:hypothetical protein|nr:hypothetical protein [Candidatus Scalindua sp.]